MAFSTVASYMIFFFAIIIMVSSIVMIYGSIVDSSNLAYTVQRERLENLAQTSLSVDSIGFDPSPDPDMVLINVTNTGSRKLTLGYLDVFIDGVRIPRDEAIRTMGFIENSSAFSPLLWDPYETLEINVSIDLGAGQHMALVTTEYGVTASRSFTV